MTNTASCVIPCLRYRNAPEAIDWLCDVFGFERHMVVPGDGNTIAHAQLRRGGGMIMLGSVVDSPYGQQLTQPEEVGGRETQTPYLFVPDADSVYLAVRQQGGEILIDIHDEDHGGRGFGCRDLEGHFWYVGTYDPWSGAEG